MMNKAINTLVLATVDSLTKFKNKLAYYLAIFAMVFGSTFGTFNAANADDSLAIANGATFTVTQADEATDFAAFASNAVTANFSISSGDFTLASLTADVAAENVITVVDTGSGGAITITGDLTLADGAGDLKFIMADKTTTLTFGGNVTDSTGTGNVVITANSNDIVVISGTNKTIDATMDGIADGEGTLRITGAGTTMADKVGTTGTTALAAIDVNAAATFSSTSSATNYTIDADTTFTGAVEAELRLQWILLELM